VEGFAGLLLGRGLEPGGRVVIALPNGPEFFFAFYGAQRAGGVAVPVYPGAGPGRITDLARLCGAKFVVAPSGLPAASPDSLSREGAGSGLQVVTVAEQASSPAWSHFPPVQPGDIAFLQYTSGSTGNPKGVILTQANLLTNVRQMIAGMEITREEIFVSWLPVYHDMGLILMTMVPFYLGAQAHLLPANLREVRNWLEAIQAQRGTFTAAPDFAYRLVLRHLDPGEFELSSLRVALNAAEPVRAGTISAFERAFGLKNVMVAGYGLAEATVGVSMAKPGTAPRVDDRGRVSAGRPFPGVELRILAGDEILPAGEPGEIAIRSQANCQGYFGNPDETARLFWRDGYLRSGDLGYLDRDGCLFITGRKKNIIKRSGETISPQEIEELVDAQPEVRYSAAVGIDQGRDEGEQVYVFAEIREAGGLHNGRFQDLVIQIVRDFHARMGFRPARVYLLKPRSIPLTHNGKLQHGRLKEMYLDGALRRQGSILFPEY
jgi:acyl-CoA synthetase (AMP-forming)/AMP-acid ligase II